VPNALASPRSSTASPTTVTTKANVATLEPRALAKTVASTSRCGPNVASGLASNRHASQLITVEGSTYTTTYATVSAWSRVGACWSRILGPWTGRIGANGFSDHKIEGDDATPAGAYGIGPVMYGIVANPGVHYRYRRLVCGDWWDETPSSPQYNTFQHVPCGTAPTFGGDSEALWEEKTAYPSFAVIDYNTSPVVAGNGSATFLRATVGGPTAGCVSLPLAELDTILRWLKPANDPLVVMGPASEIEHL
jgi:L,D-peptidoglycan transpeptidase YkuD (ErfK/YbiS/YcfS/YnhG family)